MHAQEAIMCNHQINTFRCQQRLMEHKGGHWLIHEECIVLTAVYQNTHLGLKQHQTEKNQACSVSHYLCLSEGISQSGTQSVENSIK